MIAYWLMFLVPLWALVTRRPLRSRQSLFMWWVVGALFALMIGLRHEVGGDWYNYLRHFDAVSSMRFLDAVQTGDPGHYAINWLVSQLGGSVHWVNLLYASVLMWGTVLFCRRQPFPWLAMLVAVPYMLIVVGMGYSRQAMALGLALLGLVALGGQRIPTFVVCIVVGALFHKSAILLLPTAALAASRNRFFTGTMITVTFALLYYLLVSEEADSMWTSYVEQEMESQGAVIRVLMNSVPAVLMLVFGRSLAVDGHERKLWTWISLLALVCLPLVWFASTAVDRVALYLIPLQVFVLSRLPCLAGSDVRLRTLLVLSVVGYYALAQFVWLNFATHADYWLPYRAWPWS